MSDKRFIMETMTLDNLEVKSPKPISTEINTGIVESKREAIAGGLKKLLADSYCLMLMSQNYHWNVQGMNFRTIHLMTEEHYTDLFEAVDEVAERIRALGFKAPGTMTEFNDLTSLNLPNSSLSEQEMIADLLEGHEAVARTSRDCLSLCDNSKDEVTIDLLTDRMNYHEKTAWMLRSMLEK
jgi:starvation-inducible DNA-binding protein